MLSNIDWPRIMPVIVSVIIIMIVAALRNHSRALAAVLATMPINVPLGLWVVSSGANVDQAAMVEFAEGLLLGILPTVLFLVAVWLALRAGFTLVPVLLIGYGVWAAGLGVGFLLRSWFGG